jgi:hypothetical protein
MDQQAGDYDPELFLGISRAGPGSGRAKKKPDLQSASPGPARPDQNDNFFAQARPDARPDSPTARPPVNNTEQILHSNNDRKDKFQEQILHSLDIKQVHKQILQSKCQTSSRKDKFHKQILQVHK